VAKQWACQTFANDPYPHINAELLLMFTQYSFSYNSQIECFWTFFPVLVMWNSCPSFSEHFSYTLYSS
jgi:hypothetical protein